jgi:hypothetical protein
MVTVTIEDIKGLHIEEDMDTLDTCEIANLIREKVSAHCGHVPQTFSWMIGCTAESGIVTTTSFFRDGVTVTVSPTTYN